MFSVVKMSSPVVTTGFSLTRKNQKWKSSRRFWNLFSTLEWLPCYINSYIIFLSSNLSNFLVAIVTEDEVADEVWEIISENITTVDDWRMLSEKLGFGKGNFISNFFTWRWSAASMKEFFQSKRISWAVLKKELHNLNREDIIEKLCEKTNLTKSKTLFFNYI